MRGPFVPPRPAGARRAADDHGRGRIATREKAEHAGGATHRSGRRSPALMAHPLCTISSGRRYVLPPAKSIGRASSSSGVSFASTKSRRRQEARAISRSLEALWQRTSSTARKTGSSRKKECLLQSRLRQVVRGSAVNTLMPFDEQKLETSVQFHRGSSCSTTVLYGLLTPNGAFQMLGPWSLSPLLDSGSAALLESENRSEQELLGSLLECLTRTTRSGGTSIQTSL